MVDVAALRERAQALRAKADLMGGASAVVMRVEASDLERQAKAAVRKQGGFAALSPDQRAAISSKGGKALAAKPGAHAAAGTKGGDACASMPGRMANRGRKGGQTTARLGKMPTTTHEQGVANGKKGGKASAALPGHRNRCALGGKAAAAKLAAMPEAERRAFIEARSEKFRATRARNKGDEGRFRMNQSGIEWILNDDGSPGLTCNPVVGCEEVSSGCKLCWAKTLVATRMSRNPKLPMYHDLARVTEGGKAQWSGIVKLMPERLKDIVALGRARKRVAEKRNEIGKLVPLASRVFICDMSDLFHDDVPFEYIAAVFGAMACAPNSLFYVLTKRPARALAWAEWIAEEGKEVLAEVGEDPPPGASPIGAACLMYLHEYGANHTDREAADLFNTTNWPLPNVAFGVTVEDKRYGLPRLELARKFPARWHWLSVEPQLEDLGDVDFSGFDLVVEGGEAGDGSRTFDLQWARNVRDAARKAGARFFMKQMGDEAIENGLPLALGKKGNVLERFPADLRIRENLPMPSQARP